MQAPPIAEGIYTDEAFPRLIGGRDLATGELVFPCPDDKTSFEPLPLERDGTVWSYTCQRFRPKSPPYAGPEDFTPFVMAYVELPKQLIVAARLVEIAPDDVEIGMPVELCFVPLHPASADSVRIHAFRPRSPGART